MIPLWLLEHTNTFFLQYRLLWRNQFVDYPQGHHPPSCISFAYGLLGFFLALAYTNQIYWLISSRKQGLAWPRLRPISKCEYTTGGLNVAFGIQYQQYRRINTFHYWPIYLFNRTPSFRCLAWKNNRPASGAVGRERGGTPIRRFFPRETRCSQCLNTSVCNSFNFGGVFVFGYVYFFYDWFSACKNVFNYSTMVSVSDKTTIVFDLL